MHGIGAHSAMAIKRQRKRREQYVKKYKSKHKRQTNQIEEGPEDENVEKALNSTMSIGTITTFHIGLIFLFISVLLFLSAVITIYNQKDASEIAWREVAELIGTCIICLVIGVFLLVLNRVYNKNEEEQLNKYVNRRLMKSQSGNIIYKENSKDISKNNIEV